MNTYNTHTLGNGLRIIHLQHESEVVYCGYAIKGGARNEAMVEEGLAHFCEHLTFKGTAHLSPLQVINSLEKLGGELNAYTAKEETVYYAAILRQFFTKAVDVLTDIVFRSTYPQAEIEKEMEVVCDEIDSYRDNPAELIYDEFESRVFRARPLGHSVLGTKDNVRSFTTEHCKRFTKAWYRPDNAVFYVLGNVDFQRLVIRLERLLSDYPAALPAVPSSAGIVIPEKLVDGNGILRQEEDYVCDEELQTHQSHVMTGLAFTRNLERWRIPLFVVNNMLGGPSMNSRLNLALRERRGLVYTVEGIMTTYSDAMLWSVYFGCDKKDVKRCIRLVNSQLERLRHTPLTRSALASVKTQLKGQIALASQQKENFAIDMAKQYLHRGTLRSNERLYSLVDSVTVGDIHTLANEILNKDNLFTLVYT